MYVCKNVQLHLPEMWQYGLKQWKNCTLFTELCCALEEKAICFGPTTEPWGTPATKTDDCNAVYA